MSRLALLCVGMPCPSRPIALHPRPSSSSFTLPPQPPHTLYRTVTAEQEEDDDWGVVQKPVEQLYTGNRQAAELMSVNACVIVGMWVWVGKCM